MARYCTPADCTDPALRVQWAHCVQADTRVRADLLAAGLSYAEVDALDLPNDLLRSLAVAYASSQCALEGARGESDLMEKHKAYEGMAKSLRGSLSRAVFALDPQDGTTGAYGSVAIARG